MNKSTYLYLGRLLISIVCAKAITTECTAATVDEELPFILAASPNGEYRDANETIRIQTNTTFAQKKWDRLAWELDNIDISSMMKQTLSYIEFTPSLPLAKGKHELRVVHYQRDGSIEELGFWVFETQEVTENAFDFAAHIDLTSSRRIKDKALLTNDDDSSAQGSVSVQTDAVTGQWQFNSNMDFLYSDTPVLLNQKHDVNLSSFLLSIKNGGFTARAGQHKIATESLIMEHFKRRGISTEFLFDAIKSRVTGFAFRPDRVAGLTDVVGTNNAEQRVSGLAWDFVPVNNKSQQILISTTYLSGEGNSGGIGTGLFNIDQKGRGSSLSADVNLFDRQLRIRGEAAKTRFDFDGDEGILVAEDDNAYNFLAVYSPHIGSTGNTTNHWALGVEVAQVGTFFKSLANPTLPADKDLQRIFMEVGQGSWFVNASFGEEANNLENDTRFAATDIQQWYIDSSYHSPDPDSASTWLGTPSYQLRFSGTELEDSFTPEGFERNHTDTKSVEVYNQFQHNTWDWSLGLGRSTFTDKAKFQVDSEIHSLQLAASFQLGQYAWLAPFWQLQNIDNLNANTSQKNHVFGFAGNWTLLNERLDLSWDINLNKFDARNDLLFAQDFKSKAISSDLHWHWILPKTNKPGFDISLSLMAQKLEDRLNPEIEIDNYQVFINLNMVWPLAAGIHSQ